MLHFLENSYTQYEDTHSWVEQQPDRGFGVIYDRPQKLCLTVYSL